MTGKSKATAGTARPEKSNAPDRGPEGVKTSDHRPGSGGEKEEPRERKSVVSTSITQEKLVCPRCGKATLHAEFPDHYEAWTKCSDCGFFMGMSNDDWHRMENSPNINEKIKKMAIRRDLLPCED